MLSSKLASCLFLIKLRPAHYVAGAAAQPL